MTIILHLPPDIESGLLAKAEAEGLVLEDYLLQIVEAIACVGAGGAEDRVEAVRRMLEFGRKHRLRLDQPVTREMLHEEHRF